MSDDNRNLYYLHELSDYKVVDQDPDVRGWKLTDRNGSKIGTVENFLVSKDARKVRYLDVKVDQSIIEEDHEPFADHQMDSTHEFVNRDGENHLIVPIGLTRIDENDKKVLSDEVNRDTFARTKRIREGEVISPEYEVYALRSYRGNDMVPVDTRVDQNYYSRKEFDDSAYRGNKKGY